MFCENCGSKIPEESRFCPECGHKVEIISNETTQAANDDDIPKKEESSVGYGDRKSP